MFAEPVFRLITLACVLCATGSLAALGLGLVARARGRRSVARLCRFVDAGCGGGAARPDPGAVIARLAGERIGQRAADQPPAAAPLSEADLPEQRLIEQKLRDAVGNDEFVLHYQPIFNAETLAVVSYEALLRWKRPLGGFVAPGQFIPVAEACGAMLAIGLWALETACAEAATWPQRHGISLNLSLVQLQNAGLPEQVADILARTGLPASRLELEISEKLLIGNSVPVLEVMRALQAQGIRIALDDFGSGTASLGHINCFPFDRVKIHRSFVVELGGDPNADAIVGAVLAMARDGGLHVTATGVETEQQLAMLRSLRCNHLQGFLLGRPGPGIAPLLAATG